MDKPAFPRPVSSASNSNLPEDCVEFEYGQDGMSLLEYYAGQAMSGFLANCDLLHANNAIAKDCGMKPTKSMTTACFDYAEAMIKEAEKRRIK